MLDWAEETFKTAGDAGSVSKVIVSEPFTPSNAAFVASPLNWNDVPYATKIVRFGKPLLIPGSSPDTQMLPGPLSVNVLLLGLKDTVGEPFFFAL